MTELEPYRYDAAVLAPHDSVRVIAMRHPLRGERIDRRVMAGDTVRELLDDVFDDLSAPLVVHLTDESGSVALERALWHRVRPKPGTTLTARPALQGDTLKTVALIAVAVAAIVIAPYLAPFIVGALGVSLAVATGLATFAIVTAGTLAVNALFPTAGPRLSGEAERFVSRPSIAGARNQARPYDPIPVLLGEHRMALYHAAAQFTESVGDDIYLRLLLTLGYGPLNFSINDVKIGETLINTFSFEYEALGGTLADPAVTLYPADVDSQDLAIELFNNGSGGPEDFWETRVTVPNTDQAIVEATAPEGIFLTDDDGNPGAYNVVVETRFRAVGGVAYTSGGNLPTFTRALNPARRALAIGFPARGQYEVQVRRLTGESSSQRVRDKVLWTGLRSYTMEAPIAPAKPLALIALRIKATGELSGEIQTINVVARSLVTAFDGASWGADRVSSNPADLFRHVLQGPANARPVADAMIDLENLEGWWTYCRDQGFTYNAVIANRTTVFAILFEIAAAGRAVPTFIDGKWGVIWDRPDDTIVQHFTPRNSWGFKGSRAYARLPHALRCRFINADNGYTDDERIVYDDGYDESNATLFEAFEFPGVTDPDLIWRHARFHIAQARLRPEKFTLNADWENLVCTRGDRVRVTHDAALIGLASGRVKSVAGQTVVLDEILTLAADTDYGIRFRLADGSFVNRAVATPGPAETGTLALEGTGALPEAGDLFAFGPFDQDSAIYRIYAIEHLDDLVARITLVDDAPEISEADQGAIPDYDPHVTIPQDPLFFPPRDLHVVEMMEGYGPSVVALVRLSWQAPHLGAVRAFEVQQRDDATSTDFVTAAVVPAPATSVDLPLVNAGVWSYRVRALYEAHAPSSWITAAGNTFAGLSSAPDDITNLHERLLDGQTHLAWTPISAVAERRTVHYEIRKGTTWDTGLLVGDELAQPPWPATGDGTYHLRVYVLSPYGARIYSDGTASILIGDSIKARNIILNVDEQATGWTGAIDGGVIDGSFIRTDIAETIGEAFAEGVIADLALEGTHIAVYVSATTVDVGRAAECRFWVEYGASGVLQGEDFLAGGDVLGSSDILGSASTRLIRVIPIWRFSSDGDTDVFAPADIFTPPDVFTANVTWSSWVAVSQGARKARYFQPGLVLITDEETVDATGTAFSWFVDVPDRIDTYTALTIPAAGYALSFYEGGFRATPSPGAAATPFKGGPKSAPGEGVPHGQWSIVPAIAGYEVEIGADLSLAGGTIKVKDTATGSYVEASGVNLLFHGY